VTEATAAPPAPVAEDERPHRRRLGWLLLVPGMLWLAVFFVYPTIQLFFTSLYDPAGSYISGWAMTWHFANYGDAINDTSDLFVRSFIYAGIATVVCLFFL
jgi:spermidine/putrescine transport system permease protein